MNYCKINLKIYSLKAIIKSKFTEYNDKKIIKLLIAKTKRKGQTIFETVLQIYCQITRALDQVQLILIKELIIIAILRELSRIQGVKLIKQVEHLKKQNSSQINNLSQNYEMQVQTIKRSSRIITRSYYKFESQIKFSSEINKKCKNIKLKFLIKKSTFYFKLLINLKKLKNSKLRDQARKFNKQKMDVIFQREIINQNISFVSLSSIGLKYIDLTTQLQAKLSIAEAEVQYFRDENQQLNEIIQVLRNQVSSIEQHFELNVGEQRKASMCQQNKNLNSKLYQMAKIQIFQNKCNNLGEVMKCCTYEIQNQKNGDNTLRLKLYKTIEKKQNS